MAHRYWRIYCHDNAFGNTWSLAELELRGSVGGADLTGSGTPASSGNWNAGTNPLSNLFDNNTATWWACNTEVGWVSYDFGSAVDVVQVSMTARNDVSYNQAPITFTLEWSDDNVSWTQAWAGTASWTAAGQTKTFVEEAFISVSKATLQVGSIPSGLEIAVSKATLQVGSTDRGRPAEDAQLLQGRVRSLPDSAGRVRLSQARTRTLIQFPAEEAQLTQARSRFLWGGPGGFQLRFTQGLVRTLIKFGLDSRKLRAWTFTQDDHDFYVLQLGGDITLIYDKLTGMWAQWRSPGYTYWRGSDGVQWEGWNLTCDTESGILWEIDAEGRLDDGVTPIVSVMYGGFTKRFRVEDLCFMAELALSEGQPPSGIEEGSTGITLRTSDDGGLTWVSHGEIPGEAASEDITVRWYGLGRMNHPNKLFEITDTGYARRVDGLDVEVSKNG